MDEGQSSGGRALCGSGKALAGTLRAAVETVQTDEVTIHIATPETILKPGCVYLDFHGGALVVGGGEACRAQARMQADQHGAVCYGVDYRMPPEHPYPAALDDALAAYRYVLERHAPSRIIVGGRSAGGNLAAAMLLRGRDEGLPMPAGMTDSCWRRIRPPSRKALSDKVDSRTALDGVTG